MQAGGVTFAMQVVRTGTLAAGNPSVPGSTQTSSLRYFHHDQLGSIAAVTEGNTGASMGSVIERLAHYSYSYPWGKRRNTNGLSDTADSLVGLTTERGFTEHEHLDELGIIHMNGRIYDPLVGRFLSADPFIQAPSMLQSYNRYAYVMNNPLNLTDPSGYNWFSKLMHLGDRISSIGVSLGSPYLYHKSVNFLSGSGGYQLKSAALGYVSLFCGPAVAVCAGGFQGALARGYGASHDDALEAGVVAGITAAAFTAAGKVGNAYGVNSFGQYAAHAVTGCVTAAAGGGQCGQGAVSAVFGKFASNHLGINGDGLQYDIANGIIAATAGGVGSVLGGGKFANGARTAAYGYLFNQLSQGSGSVRARMATYALKMVDSTDYGDWDQSGNQRPGTYKCNIYVSDVAIAAGAEVPYSNRGIFGNLPITAGQWADKNTAIPGWRILSVNEAALPGDVVARGVGGQSDFTGHVGVVVGVRSTASVSHGAVIVNGFGFRATDTSLTFRRWEGK